MKQRDLRTFLWDIETGCATVRRILEGKTFDDYVSDETTRLAVERALEIIAEALRNEIAIEPSLVSRLTDVPQIIAFRNQQEVRALRATPAE